MSDFLQTVRDRVVIYDGAMGTNIQKRNPTLDDYWGKENCSEVLVLSRPDIIRDIHADFFNVVCDVVDTNTFGGTGIVVGEFALPDRLDRMQKLYGIVLGILPDVRIQPLEQQPGAIIPAPLQIVREIFEAPNAFRDLWKPSFLHQAARQRSKLWMK